MATLENKLLDGGVAGYCSSSDDESNSQWKVAKDEDEHQSNVMQKMGGSSNTGAKGVLSDFADFKNNIKKERAAREKAIIGQAKRGNLQGTKEEIEKAQASSDEEEDSLESLRAKRLLDMKKALSGRVAEVTEKMQYTQAIDGCKGILVGVMIYEPDREECEKLTHVLKILAFEYPKVRFIRAKSTLLEMSKNFTEQALPTLQFYFNGHLVGNFIRMSSILGEDYDQIKLKTFLKANHIHLQKNRYALEEFDDDDEDKLATDSDDIDEDD